MSCIINKKYKIIEKIGEGTFGKIFKTININNNKELVVKIQYKDVINALKNEAKIYRYLSDCSFVPQIYNYGTEQGFHYIIIDLLKSSLYDISLNNNQILSYFYDSINIIEFIHNKNLLHRDIKPENFMINEKHQLFIIDFGLTSFYIEKDKHIQEKKIDKLIGTPNYCSLNIHEGLIPSRRDDIESICYSFMYNFCKNLPWQIISKINDTSNNKIELFNNIYNLKKTSLEFYLSMPGEMVTILYYCRGLSFFENPNYNYIKNTIKNLKLLNNY